MPGSRWISGSTLRDAKSPSAIGSMSGLSDDRMVNSRKFDRDLSTRTPCCVTAAGSRGRRAAEPVLHVHLSKVRVGAGLERQGRSVPVPLAWLTDSM